MVTTYYDKPLVLTINATLDEAADALSDSSVKSVELHKPGSIRVVNGRKYRVDSQGRWKKL